MDLTSITQILGNVGEFFGAIGVIASLIYLSRQIQSSSQAQRSATQHDVLQAFRADINVLLADDDLRDIFRAVALGKPVERGHGFKISLFIGNQFRIYEELYLAFLDGSVTPALWESRRRTMRDLYLSHEVTRRWWPTVKESYSKPFVDLVSELGSELSGPK